MRKEGKLPSENDIKKNWPPNATMPLVTIACAAYNAENFIEDAIFGFLIQETAFPFEVLIHDDASTDGTSEVIVEYERRYPTIIRSILRGENLYSKGVRVGPLLLYPKARGKYIATCEGDDFWVDPLKLQKQADFLDANPDYAICYTNSQPFNESGLLDIDFGGAVRDLSRLDLKMGTPIFTLTACFRNIFTDLDFPDVFKSARYGDLVIWTLLGEYGKGKFLIDIKPSMYRVHDKGIHSTVSPERRREMRLLTDMAAYLYFDGRHDGEIARHYAHRIISSISPSVLWEWLIFKYIIFRSKGLYRRLIPDSIRKIRQSR